MTPQEEARERVANGSTLLDTKAPGWHERIDLERLRLAEGCNCILAQLYGGYIRGRDRLFGDDTNDDGDEPWDLAAACGFTSTNSYEADLNEVEAEWRRLILARRTALKAPEHGADERVAHDVLEGELDDADAP